MTSDTLRRILLAGACVAMLSGCVKPHARAIPVVAKVEKVQPRTEHVFHFKDGRYGYADDSGMWWYFYLVQMQSGAATTARPASYVGVASSTAAAPVRGAAPSKGDLEAAEESDMEIAETASGAPATEEETVAAEAEAADAAGETGAAQGADAAGGAGQTQTAGEAAGGGGEAGGGGDAGGGGGDGGGGGGD